MKVMISYFNNIRNFTEDMIPLSTAMWDPKWYHNNEGEYHVFVDKRGIINGLRIERLCLPHKLWTNLDVQCEKNCKQVPNKCEFMKVYRKYLDSLNFNALMSNLEAVAQSYAFIYSKPTEIKLVLIVHEKPERDCAERPVLKAWFKDHGYDLEEVPYGQTVNAK